MLGSDQVGERDNAAQLVERFRQQRGLTWGDVLTSRGLSNIPPGPARRGQEKAFNQAAPEAATGHLVIHRMGTRDTLWRWSMLAGLAVVGCISLTTLIQQHAPQYAPQHAMNAKTEAAVCPGGPCFASAHVPASTKSAAASVAAAAAAASTTPFAQGVADRGVWETWRKSTPAGLCSGPFRPDQEELKSACAITGKLLAKFNQRRRTDPEYRRGWNSLSA